MMSHPTIYKRLLAATYDSFLLLGTTFLATALTLPFNKGEVQAEHEIFMSLYLLSVIYVFYGWFWTHGGQTLGMRSWKQQLVSLDQSAITWQQSFIRFITGLPAWLIFFIGLILMIKPSFSETLTAIPPSVIALTGFAWVLLDNKNGNWRDKLSKSHVITLS